MSITAITALLRVYSESCYFISYTSNIFKYLKDGIVFVYK